jgi:hypothetical protein
MHGIRDSTADMRVTAGTLTADGIPLEALPQGSALLKRHQEIIVLESEDKEGDKGSHEEKEGGETSADDAADDATLAAFQNVRQVLCDGWLPTEEEENEEDSQKNSAFLLIRTRFADRAQCHVVRHRGGSREQVTFFPDRVAGSFPCPLGSQKRKIDAAEPSLAGSFLLLRDEGGNERHQLSLHPGTLVSGGARRVGGESEETSVARWFSEQPFVSPVPLTDGVSRHVSPVWSPQGDGVAFGGNARNGKDTDVYFLPLRMRGNGNSSQRAKGNPLCSQGRVTVSDFAVRLTEQEGMWTPEAFSPNGRQLLVSHYISTSRQELFLVDIPGDATLDALPTESSCPEMTRVFRVPDGAQAAFGSLAFAADGRGLFVSTDFETEFKTLRFHDLESGVTSDMMAGVDVGGAVEMFRLSSRRKDHLRRDQQPWNERRMDNPERRHSQWCILLPC